MFPDEEEDLPEQHSNHIGQEPDGEAPEDAAQEWTWSGRIHRLACSLFIPSRSFSMIGMDSSESTYSLLSPTSTKMFTVRKSTDPNDVLNSHNDKSNDHLSTPFKNTARIIKESCSFKEIVEFQHVPLPFKVEHKFTWEIVLVYHSDRRLRSSYQDQYHFKLAVFLYWCRQYASQLC
jgi:hypothetical protein